MFSHYVFRKAMDKRGLHSVDIVFAHEQLFAPTIDFQNNGSLAINTQGRKL